MNEIIFPLKKNMSGEAVADFQEGLRFLINKDVIKLTGAERQMYHEALGGERIESIYGEATHKLVRLFQQQHQFDPSCEVDEQTEGRLNELLFQLGAIASDKDDLMYRAKSKVIGLTRA